MTNLNYDLTCYPESGVSGSTCSIVKAGTVAMIRVGFNLSTQKNHQQVIMHCDYGNAASTIFNKKNTYQRKDGIVGWSPSRSVAGSIFINWDTNLFYVVSNGTMLAADYYAFQWEFPVSP